WLLWLAPYAFELALILAPLTVYLLYLGLDVNSRPRPVVWSGRRNVLLLAVGLSGFFLLGPPTWVFSKLQWYGPVHYAIGYGVYFLLVLLVLRSWLARQRYCLVLLNTPPAVIAEVLPKVIQTWPGEAIVTPGRAVLGGGALVLDVNVNERWHSAELRGQVTDPQLWAEFDERLRVALSTHTTPRHGAGRALSLLGAALAILSTQALMLFAWYRAN
ncbi:MAG TPA: hypothetical protein PKD86_09225, partial [Gemmatales bacterium]|nr:hypothetical protein [Gemmatales bacterium]